jgi:hypothetical protein
MRGHHEQGKVLVVVRCVLVQSKVPVMVKCVLVVGRVDFI